MERPRPDESAVRDALKEEQDRVEAEPAAGSPQPAEEDLRAADSALSAEEDGSTDEGSGEDAGEPAGAAEPVEDESARVAREREEYLDLAKRTQADFENYRKRAAKDIAAAGARARVGLIRELLPVVDNLERALAGAPADDPMAEGVRLVLMDLHGVLAREGVEAIEPAGETFDPNVHEALTTRQQDGVEAGVVLDVVEKGYRGADQVIRPARVIVAA